MRVVSEDLDAEVAGTSVGDRLEVHAWRGAELVASHLDVVAWSFDWDADRAVQGQGTVTVADPDGTLAPWGFGDALAPGGSRLQVTWVSGASGTRVPLGRWRIRAAEPREQWRVYTHRDGVTRVPGGGQVTLQVDEETSTIELSRMDAEVVTAATCVAEVRRLLADICSVVAHDDVVDGNAPKTLAYGESRMDAVIDLLDRINATYRMGPEGSLEVVPKVGVGPVWALEGGAAGVLIGVERSLSDEGVYNAAVSTGDTNGRPLVGRAYLQTGPLAYGGPFGQVPIFHQSIASTQSGVEADARTLLTNRQASGEADLTVTCLAHPGLQVHDVVTILAPTTVGDQPITGRLVGMSLRSAGSVPAKAMNLTVRVSVEALEAIAARVRRG